MTKIVVEEEGGKNKRRLGCYVVGVLMDFGEVWRGNGGMGVKGLGI